MLSNKKQCARCGASNPSANDICNQCGSTMNSAIPSSFGGEKQIHTYEQEDTVIPRKIFLQEGDMVRGEKTLYKVLATIGTGGFGTVYQVKGGLGQIRALKLLHLWEVDKRDFEEIKSRFKREYEAGKIESPYIVASHEIGIVKGNPFIIMDYYEGGDLRMRISDFWTESQVTSLAVDVLKGLYELHKEGIIHRDLKPENILFDKDDNAVLSDFGISGFIRKRGTQVDKQGKIINQWGTVIYMPPEQIDMKKAFHTMGPVTDVFGFGVLMYEVFSSGYLPFGDIEDEEKDLKRFYEKVRKGDWYPITDKRNDLSDNWIRILKKCLHPEQDKRFQSPKEILKELGFWDKKSHQSRLINYKGALTLQIKNGDEIGQIYILNDLLENKHKKLLKLGWFDEENESANDIGIVEKFTEYISYFHATFEFIDNQWSIRDGQWREDEDDNYDWFLSTNGILVNGKEIGKFGTLIYPNDIITIGDTTLKVDI